MSGTLKIGLAVVAALLIFGGIALVGINSQNSATNGGTNANSAPNLNAVQDKDVAATITYTGKGFEPNTATISVNSTVRIRNRSVRVLQFVSDPYPTNADEPEFNVGGLNPGDSKTFYVSQKGTWGYHNALDPSETGQLFVR
jgi:hypothetical protein